MFNIGPQELLVILLVALVIVGPQRLPELARTIGRALNELRRAQDEVTRTIRLGLDETEPTSPGAARTRAQRGDAPVGAGDGRAAEGDEGGGPREAGAAGGAEAGEGAVEVARTLGRGLAEIRRARREVQRTFRLDLTEDPAPPGRPAVAGPSAPTPAPEPSHDAGSPDEGSAAPPDAAGGG